MNTTALVANYVGLARCCNHLMLECRREGVWFGSLQHRDMRDYYMRQARWEARVK